MDEAMQSPTRSTKRYALSQQDQQQEEQQQQQKQEEHSSIFLPIFDAETQTSQSLPITRARSSFERRATKSNPLLDRSSAGRASGKNRETRRKLFLKQVQEKRGDALWARRNGAEGEDELMRVLWSGERAREIARLQREGETGGAAEENLDEVMVDEIDSWERGELEALLASQELEDDLPLLRSTNDLLDRSGGSESVYGSDDDEYDSIFQNVFDEEMRMSQSQSQQRQEQGSGLQHDDDQDMMDLS